MVVQNSKYLVAFVAIGNNYNYVSQNYNYFPDHDCILFQYKNIFTKFKNCHIITEKWSWSKFLYSLTKNITKRYDYTTIVLDDLKLLNYSFFKTIEYMSDNSVSNPTIIGSYYNSISNNINHTEIFATTFTRKAWACWWDMMDILNIDFGKSIGWGFDLCFPVYCPFTKHIKTSDIGYHVSKKKSHTLKMNGNDEVLDYAKKIKKKIGKCCNKQVR